MDLVDVVVQALAMELKTAEENVRSAVSLKADLNMDSIAAVNVAFALEDKFDVEIEVEDGDSFDSVMSIVRIVRRALDVAE